MQTSDLYINVLNWLMKPPKTNQNLTDVLPNHTPQFFQKIYSTLPRRFKILIKRAGRIVTKLYLHFTFEQDCFKKEFVLSNQKSRQNAKNDIEKKMHKLKNNANFVFDCRNNVNNTKFEPVIDEIGEITNIKK